MSRLVWIQKEDGQFVNANTFNAWRGFEQRGFEIRFFSWSDLDAGRVEVRPETPVVGGVGTVRLALSRLGIDPPPLDYPEELRDFLGRRVWRTTWKEIRGRFANSETPEAVFVKPAEGDKTFAGYVLRAFRDLIPTARWPDSMPLWASEVVELISEWRVFVHHGQAIGIGHYRGDALRFPDAERVRKAIDAFSPARPVACAMDFGLTDDGRTILIECNDAFSLGCYGLGPLAYSGMLRDRWEELTASNRA